MFEYMILEYRAGFGAGGDLGPPVPALLLCFEPERAMYGLGVSPGRKFDPRPLLAATSGTHDDMMLFDGWLVSFSFMLKTGAPRDEMREWVETATPQIFTVGSEGHIENLDALLTNFRPMALDGRQAKLAFLYLMESSTGRELKRRASNYYVIVGREHYVAVEIFLSSDVGPGALRTAHVKIQRRYGTKERYWVQGFDLDAPALPEQLEAWLDDAWPSRASY